MMLSVPRPPSSNSAHTYPGGVLVLRHPGILASWPAWHSAAVRSAYFAEKFSLPLRNWSSEKVKIDFATCVVCAPRSALPYKCQLFIKQRHARAQVTFTCTPWWLFTDLLRLTRPQDGWYGIGAGWLGTGDCGWYREWVCGWVGRLRVTASLDDWHMACHSITLIKWCTNTRPLPSTFSKNAAAHWKPTFVCVYTIATG